MQLNIGEVYPSELLSVQTRQELFQNVTQKL